MSIKPDQELLIIGKITAPHGIKGEVKVLSYSDFPTRFTKPGVRYLLPHESAEPNNIELVKGYALQPNLYVLQLQGISDRNQAEKLRNFLLAVPKDDLPPLGADEFHISDLIGCVVIYQPSHILIGKVSGVLSAGNDVLEITGIDDQATALVPFVKAIAPVVDIGNQRIEITPPDGLVEQLIALAHHRFYSENSCPSR